uniref:Uncharacterized protein n=1 Tax=Setaria viridis TaxID=4556 RepID=A0A4U6UMU6_SETVI|nr:hypothetical protein SEVIR_5G378266v2 [Setaria viridis]
MEEVEATNRRRPPASRRFGSTPWSSTTPARLKHADPYTSASSRPVAQLCAIAPGDGAAAASVAVALPQRNPAIRTQTHTAASCILHRCRHRLLCSLLHPHSVRTARSGCLPPNTTVPHLLALCRWIHNARYRQSIRHIYTTGG